MIKYVHWILLNKYNQFFFTELRLFNSILILLVEPTGLFYFLTETRKGLLESRGIFGGFMIYELLLICVLDAPLTIKEIFFKD